jgi:hypothetical protein
MAEERSPQWRWVAITVIGVLGAIGMLFITNSLAADAKNTDDISVVKADQAKLSERVATLEANTKYIMESLARIETALRK